MNTNAPKKTSQEDWDPEDVIAALHKKRITLAGIARKHGLACSSSFSACLTRAGLPTNEARIADELGIHPMEIWPSRYDQAGDPKQRGYRVRRSPAAGAQKNSANGKATLDAHLELAAA